MDAIRRIITVKELLLQVLLPETFRNKTLEVIILPTDEVNLPAKSERFDFTQLYGKLKSGMSISEIDDKLKQLRSEWDRISD